MEFEAWLTECFSDAPSPAEVEQQHVACATRLFLNPSHYLPAAFTGPQLHRGFWKLGGSGGFFVEAMLDPRISLEARLECIAAAPALFRDFFRSQDYLSDIAFMWWEALVWAVEDGLAKEPFSKGESSENLAAIERAIVDALDKILKIDSDICRQSALHGIGHLHDALVRKAIIDRFLDANPDVGPEIRSYAADCIAGNVE